MDNLILSQIPLSELITLVKIALREELQATNAKGTPKEATEGAPPITQRELCKYLGITEPTALRWRKKGKIPCMTIGSAVRFDLNDVLEALKKK